MVGRRALIAADRALGNVMANLVCSTKSAKMEFVVTFPAKVWNLFFGILINFYKLLHLNVLE